MVTPSRQPELLSLRQAVVLGLAQGPTELLPVSSSAHTNLLPWLWGWSYAESDPQLRKSFEVALHAGSALALTLVLRRELADAASSLDRRHATVVVLSLAPPALAGLALERFIERRLGGPRSIAVGLLAGAVAMAMADARAGHGATRRREDAWACDGLAFGLAQAAALMPGVSRNGATLTAARARGFARGEATAISWHSGLPVLFGASAIKGWRLVRHGAPTGAAGTLALGGASAFISTLASAQLLRPRRKEGRSLLPYSLYRCILVAVAARRLRDERSARGARIAR